MSGAVAAALAAGVLHTGGFVAVAAVTLGVVVLAPIGIAAVILLRRVETVEDRVRLLDAYTRFIEQMLRGLTGRAAEAPSPPPPQERGQAAEASPSAPPGERGRRRR